MESPELKEYKGIPRRLHIVGVLEEERRDNGKDQYLKKYWPIIVQDEENHHIRLKKFMNLNQVKGYILYICYIYIWYIHIHSILYVYYACTYKYILYRL